MKRSRTCASSLGTESAPGAVRPSGCLPRVAFVLSQFPETHETFILREFTALSDMGLDFVILSLKPCRDKVIQKEARRFLERTCYPASTGGSVGAAEAVRAARATRASLPWTAAPLQCAYVTWAAARFASLCRRLGVGHIHAHWATAPTSAAILMSHMLGVGYSLTAHAWDIYAGDGRLGAKTRGARFVVTCTGANVDALRAAATPEDLDRIILNYHGIPGVGRGGRCAQPEAARASEPSPRFRIAAAGRLVETKGFEYLLDALQGLDFDFELTLIGEGPLRAALERRASRGPAAGRVRFAGIVPNEEVFTLFAQSDCFVMPSVVARGGDRDGIPNVMLEAMSVGLPVVASRISGIPEAVIDGETGILVPERDSAAIRDALIRLRGDARQARQMGRRGRLLVERKFSAEDNARALHGIFERFIGGKAAPGDASQPCPGERAGVGRFPAEVPQ